MPDQELADFDDDALKETLKQLNRSHGQISPSLIPHTTVSPTLEQWCQPVLFPALGIEAQTGTRIVTESGIFEPAGVIALPEQAVQAEYQGKAARRDLACLVWVLPWRSSNLDAIPAEQEQLSEEESPFAGLTYMEIAQRSLLASDVPWGIVTNGCKLRLLSKGTAHKPRAFVEMDLEAVIQQRGTQEGKLAFRYLLGLFAGESFTVLDDKDRTRLDRVLQESDRHGQEISDELKQNVFRALEELGDGFLEYMKARPDEVTAFSAEYILEPTPSDALLTEVYQESMSLMYRLLFLFYAESRDMLPMEDELYRETYSLEAIRDEIISVVDDPDPTQFFGKGSLALWGRLQELFALVEQGGLGNRIPAYDGGLFDPENHPFLVTFAVGDYYLARAIDLLSRTRPSKNRPRGEGRKKVTYRDLDVRHLGSIYEGILEYSAHIATEELAIMQRGAGGKKYEEYVGVSELKADELGQLAEYKAALAEDPENPRLPNRCKVAGVKEPGQYFLVFGGRESKRKSSGSYYTPDYIVQYIVENTLGPLVRGENREGDLHNKLLTAEEILELKVLDPAMGSGHFLVAATEFLARAYGEALIRAGRDDDGVMSEEEFIRYKRIVAERCIYGVDINPMAVELAKLSMWLFTMDKSRPLSFLNYQFKSGNALAGASLDNLEELPLFEYHFKTKVPIMIGILFQILQRETDSIQDINAKKSLEIEIESLKKPFRKILDAWFEKLFNQSNHNYYAFLSDFNLAIDFQSKFSQDHNIFHWEISFPEIYFDENAQNLDCPGFDAVIGNPPYGFHQIHGDSIKEYFRSFYKTIGGSFEQYFLFYERTLSLLKTGGIHGFIVPITWLTVPSAKKLREFILKCNKIIEICWLPKLVFAEVKVDTLVSIIQKVNKISEAKASIISVKFHGEDDFQIIRKISSFNQETFLNNDCYIGIFKEDLDNEIIEKMCSVSIVLSKISNPCSGYNPYENGKGQAPNGGIQTSETVKSKPYHSSCKISDEWKPEIVGRNLERYSVHFSGERWVKYGPWLAAPRDPENFIGRRILVQEITGGDSKRIVAAFYDEELYHSRDVIPIRLDVHRESSRDYHPYYLLAIINSKLITWYHHKNNPKSKKKLFPKILVSDLKKIPIFDLNLEIKAEKGIHDKIVSTVNSLVSILTDSRSSSQPKMRRRIAELDQSLDSMIYDLYGLTESEKMLVESVVN